MKISTSSLFLRAFVAGACDDSSGAATSPAGSAAPTAWTQAASSSAPGASADAATPSASASAAATAAPSAEGPSFFTGAVGPEVKHKAIGTGALEAPEGGSRIMLTPVEGWRGGSLPGGKYMATKGDLVFRVHEEIKPVTCESLASAAKMAPSSVTDLKELVAPTVVKAGKNGFAARVGACEGTGPKGPTEVHYADIEMKETDGTVWWGVLLVTFPKDTTAEEKEEAAAWGRAAVYNGPNGRTL
jgi:hypothetical protein